MSKKILLVLTDGFEEIEAVAPIDLLRRAGFQVIVAGLDKPQATGSHGITLQADTILKHYKDTPDALVIPGGPGSEALGRSKELLAMIQHLFKENRWIAAICAAPAVVLGPAGILKGKRATCFPGCEEALKAGGALLSTDRVVTDGRVITSRGAGTAVEFALEIIRALADEKSARDIADKILARR